MIVKTLIYLITFVAIYTLIYGKKYERCELIRELIKKHKFEHEYAAKVSCIAEASGFETYSQRVSNNERQINNYNIIFQTPHWGIFGITPKWCSGTGGSSICLMHCDKLLDDDITDDIECLMQIIEGLDDWEVLINFKCEWRRLLHGCSEFLSQSPDANWYSLDDGWTNFPEFWFTDYVHMYHASPAFYHEFPHSAAIGWSNPDSNTIEWKCGASLISEDTLLTAAHCLSTNGKRQPDILRLGDLNLETDTNETNPQQIEILSTYIHPEYRKKFNDIALIKLKTKVEVTKFVIPACLWTRHEIPRDVQLEACGFGQIKHGGQYSPILNKVSLTEISTDECQEHYYGADRFLRDGLVETAHLCADDKTSLGMDTCQGDSGVIIFDYLYQMF